VTAGADGETAAKYRVDSHGKQLRTDRRSFLIASGRAASVAGLAALLDGAAPALASRSRSPSQRQWRMLARSLRGQLVLPSDASYDRVAPPYDKRYAGERPLGVVLAADTADVQAALNFARHTGIRPIPRSGGHSYAGYSTGSGLVISLERMKRISVDSSGHVHIQPGARNFDIYATLPAQGVVIPYGRCPTVGVGGFLLGGGFGFNSRRLGTASDNLLWTEVVTADGKIRTASATSEPELFWACRGGGGGNFGINTAFTMRSHPAPSFSVYSITWKESDAVAAFEAMQEAVTRAPDGFSCRIGIDLTGHPPDVRLTARVLGQYWGPASELADLLAPVIKAARPLKLTIRPESYIGALKFLEDEVPVGRFTERSAYLPALPLPPIGEFVSTAIEHLRRWPGSSNRSAVGLAMFAWGGALNRVRPATTAFVHRNASWLFVVGASWGQKDTPRRVASNLRWLNGLSDALGRYSNGQAYQNFIDPALADWQRAYYATNLKRLVAAKREYDPDGIFRFAQGIPLTRSV
jgi:FAD/FMN-containing dehydrogenase